MMRMLRATVVALPLTLLLAGTTVAAGPASKACLGKDMSYYARNGVTVFGEFIEPGRGFGHFHYYFAQVAFHGMGEPTLLHMSGSVPAGALDVYSCGE